MILSNIILLILVKLLLLPSIVDKRGKSKHYCVLFALLLIVKLFTNSYCDPKSASLPSVIDFSNGRSTWLLYSSLHLPSTVITGVY